MPTAPLVSVIVTVYNRSEFIEACLESILASSFDDFEVVVVDDRSTDGSFEIASRVAERDSRVVVSRNEANLGDYPNRSRGASLSTGKYLKYVDSDDLIYRHGLELMVNAMEAHPSAALGLSHSKPEDKRPYPWQLSPEDAWKKEFLAGGSMGCGPTGAIFRRDAFHECGGFGSWGVLSDTDLWYRMSARWPLVLLPPALVWWRRHDGQEFTSAGASLSYLKDRYRLTASSLSESYCPLTPSDSATALEIARQHYARRLIALAVRGRSPLTALRLARESGLSAPELAGGLRRYRTT